MLKDIAQKALEQKKKVYIYAHTRPDLDAISSATAIRDYLRSKGVEAEYVVTEDVRSHKIIGNIKVSNKYSVDKDSISIITDTSTVDYAQNDLFKTSSKEDTYVIDHHMKAEGAKCIEDELELDPKNVIRDSSSASACEIVANDLLNEKELNGDIATKLTLGLMGDTAEFRYLKENTLTNFNALLENGADYQKILDSSNYKIPLSQQVGLSKMFLSTKRLPLENGLYANVLFVDKKHADFLANKYGIQYLQKKIFKYSNIKDTCANMIAVENEKGSYDFEFRSTPIYGNVNVQKIAVENGGGGHYNASGCNIKDDGSMKEVGVKVARNLVRLCKEETKEYKPIEFTDKDTKLQELLDETDRFKKNLSPEILEEIQGLNNSGANYQALYDEKIAFEKFMLKNELFSRIPQSQLDNPDVTISLDKNDFRELKEKYEISDDDILDMISMFKEENINIRSATIEVNGKSSYLDYDGTITYQKNPIGEDDMTI